MTKTLAFAAILALVASPALGAVDEGAGRPVVHDDTLIRGVRIPSAFKGLDGKTYAPGAYDLSVRQETQGILIGLLRNGKRVAEFQGRYFAGVVNRFSAGGRAPGPAGSSSLAAGLRVHFDASSRVAFGGGGAGRISCSNKLHPGGANLGSISFQLPFVQAQAK